MTMTTESFVIILSYILLFKSGNKTDEFLLSVVHNHVSASRVSTVTATWTLNNMIRVLLCISC